VCLPTTTEFSNWNEKENFRITEDGAVQTITTSRLRCAHSIVLLLEFSKLGYQYFTYNARNWSASFLSNLKPNDWVALETSHAVQR